MADKSSLFPLALLALLAASPFPPERPKLVVLDIDLNNIHKSAPDSTLADWERRLTVSAMLARIGPKCRETLRGFYLADETNTAIAQRLRKAPTYIYVLLSACRKRLSKLFRSATSSVR